MSSPLLAPLSAAYGAAVAARTALYRRGWLRSARAGVPVISVGNLAAGGTGKTPLVALVARILRDAGMSPAIVSRGYGGRRREDPLVVSEGRGPNPGVTAAQAGDEPVMLARCLGDVMIVVARKRAEGARLAAERLGARCIVLDDGFQHLALQRDLDLVLLDAEDPLDDGRLLPSGLLREGPEALARADALIFTGSHGPDAGRRSIPGRLAGMADTDSGPLERWTRPGTASFHATMEPTLVVSARDVDPAVRSGPESLTSAWLAGMRVVAFAGIARPLRLVEDLRRLGAEVVSFLSHPDHHVFTRSDVEEILERVRRLEPEVLLTTEKDVARLKGSPLGDRLIEEGLVALRVEPIFAATEMAAFSDLILSAARGERREGGGAP